MDLEYTNTTMRHISFFLYSSITEECPVIHSVECIELLCVRVETARTNRSWRLESVVAKQWVLHSVWSNRGFIYGRGRTESFFLYAEVELLRDRDFEFVHG